MDLRENIRNFNPLYLLGDPLCLGCDELSKESVCTQCLEELEPIEDRGCGRCGFPAGLSTRRDREAGDGCAWCQRLRYLPEHIHSAFAYQNTGARIFKKVKFSGYWRGMNPLIQRALPLLLPHITQSPGTRIVVVPESLQSRIRRAFHPADIFAESLSKATGVDLLSAVTWEKRGRHQVGLDYLSRKENMRNRFHVSLPEKHLKQVILVDDVLTTGATLEAITRKLRMHKINKILWVTLFRTL